MRNFIFRSLASFKQIFNVTFVEMKNRLVGANFYIYLDVYSTKL